MTTQFGARVRTRGEKWDASPAKGGEMMVQSEVFALSVTARDHISQAFYVSVCVCVRVCVQRVIVSPSFFSLYPS